MLRDSIPKTLVFLLLPSICFASSPRIFSENETTLYDENNKITYKRLHLKAIFFCSDPYKWKVWINRTCISSCHPRSIQGWVISKVTKETVTIRKGTKEKTLFIEKSNEKKERKRMGPEKEKSSP